MYIVLETILAPMSTAKNKKNGSFSNIMPPTRATVCEQMSNDLIVLFCQTLLRESHFTIFVFLYFFGSLSGFSIFCWSAFLNWHFGPSRLSAVTANSDQLS